MPKRIQPLTELQIKNSKPKKADYKISDGFGLHLLITPTGGKLWRMQYRFASKQKLLSFGSYPSVTLADARQRREDAKKLLANGVDPSEVKRAQKTARADSAANSFEVIAREWHGKFSPSWTAMYAERILDRLQRGAFPWIGSRPIAEIKAPDVLATLRRIESQGKLESAHRLRTIIGQVFRYAVATGRAERDPTGDLKGALPPKNRQHFAAMTDPREVAGLLRAIDEYTGSFVTKCALQLASLVFVRPGELRQAEWSEIDLERAEWNIPAPKMKMKHAHLVPLSQQAVAVLKELHPLTGTSKYVFPNGRSFARPMSEVAILAALRRMGYGKDEMTGHGFRAMARTILDEVLQVRPDFIEHQLAHAVKDPNGRAYNRTSHLAERRKMMQTWADYLDGLKTGAKVIPIRSKSV
jgi:integrase